MWMRLILLTLPPPLSIGGLAIRLKKNVSLKKRESIMKSLLAVLFGWGVGKRDTFIFFFV